MRASPAESERVETILNEIAADQAVFRITLQCFLLRMFAARPDLAPEALSDMKQQVLRSIGRMPVAAEDEQGGVRWKRLANDRAEELFLELEDALAASIPPPKRAGAGN